MKPPVCETSECKNCLFSVFHEKNGHAHYVNMDAKVKQNTSYGLTY